MKLIQTEKESRRAWMLSRFKEATKYHSRKKNINFGNMEITQKKFILKNFYGLNYIHLNSVKAGLDCEPQDYIYSSASNYICGKGFLKIETIDIPITDVRSTLGITRDLRLKQ